MNNSTNPSKKWYYFSWKPIKHPTWKKYIPNVQFRTNKIEPSSLGLGKFPHTMSPMKAFWNPELRGAVWLSISVFGKGTTIVRYDSSKITPTGYLPIKFLNQ